MKPCCNSAVMAIDIRDEDIGIAVAYHRQHKSKKEGIKEFDICDTNTTSSTTSITPLPPLPYMSRDPHHPSYSFRYHHRPVRPVAGMPAKPPRVERTMEVALQLGQLCSKRGVKSVLVRWPGGGAALGLGGGVRADNDEWTKEVDGDALLGHNRLVMAYKTKQHCPEGTLGYRRGRILYVLDKCCGGFGHAHTSTPLLMEGSRPFALWDTTEDEDLVKLSSRLDPSHQIEVHHSSNKYTERLDKYGNAISVVDYWGRAPIFGMPPDPSWKLKTAKQPSATAQKDSPAVLEQFGGFDTYHDAEEKIGQLKQSFQAMLVLRDFATTYLNGRVVLPSWVKLHEDIHTEHFSNDEGLTRHHDSDVHVGYRRPASTSREDVRQHSTSQNERPRLMEKTSMKQEGRGRVATLVQMPRKRRRGGTPTPVNGET